MAVLVVPQETYHAATWTLTGDSYLTEFNGDAANVITQGAKARRRKMGNGGKQPSAMQSYQKSVALGGRKIIPHPRKNIPKTATGRL